MVKATLEFTLPEENEEYKMATDASAISTAVYDFDQYLRKIIKYNDTQFSESEVNLIEQIRTELYRFFEDHDVSVP